MDWKHFAGCALLVAIGVVAVVAGSEALGVVAVMACALMMVGMAWMMVRGRAREQ